MQAIGNPLNLSLFQRNRAILHAGVVGSILIAVIVTQLILTHLQEEAEERAAIVTQNLTQSVEQTIENLIDTLDVAMLASSDEISRQMAAGKLDGASITHYLVRQKERLRHVAFLRASNERGEIIYGPDIPSPPVNNADREFFAPLRDNPNAGLYVAKPIIGKIAKKWLWPFARRINKPDGSFGGVVVAAIQIDDIEKLLAQIKLKPGSVVSVRDAELGLIARSTFDDAHLIPPGDKRLSTAFQEALKINPREGSFVSDTTAPDGISRTYSYRRNNKYGFTVNVGIAHEPMRAEIRYQTWIASALTGIFILLALSFVILIGRAWQRQEEYFRFFRLSTDAMCIADPFGCFKRVNPAFVLMTGFQEVELVAKPFLDFVLAEDRQRTAEEMRLQVAIRPSMQFENRYVCKDGKVITLSWTAYYDKTDGVTYATARDITALRQAEDRLERYFMLVPDLMCIASTSGNFLKINPAWQSLLGYSEQEILATPFIDFVHPEDKEATREAVSRQVAGEALLNFVNRYRCRDGSYRWLEWRTTQAINQVFIYATARDITERMRMEASLQESEARFRRMFEKHDTVMLLIDPGSGELVDANAAAARFYGYSIEQLKTMRIDQINILSPEETAGKRAQAVQHESNVFVFPHRLASGKVRTVEVRSSPVEVAGRVLLFSIINDITDREIATAELKRSNAELEQFSYAISHDMRQPLRMISSYLQLLEAALVEQLDEEKREFFDFAIDGAKRLDKMLVALLEYSRVGRMGEPPAWVESRDLRDETLLLLQPMITEAKAVVHIEGEWPQVFVSPDEILRLLQNLIGNALKFRVAGRMPEVTLSSETTESEWRIVVADNGIGIIPDQIGRLFQVFQRLHARAAYEGTGVGLALCRKIAEHHGGRIWAESAGTGQGSRFCVVLPLHVENSR